ncbi:hypothetical protein J7M00_07820 [bacterium]|nr:hypothetical protein [bacterium]
MKTIPFYFTINNASWKGYVAPISATTERWLEHIGESKLVDGVCRIDLPQDFLESTTIDEDNPMQVSITPYGDLGRYTVQRGYDHLTVHQIEGDQSATFSYRISAKVKGAENEKLSEVDLMDVRQ